MSTPKENNNFSTENILCSINFVVQKERLGDAVKRIREANKWSLADVRRQSGKQLAISYISRIENNQIDAEVLSIAKVQALAKGLKTSEELVFALARGIDLENIPASHEINHYLSKLPKSRQKDILDIAKLFHSQQKDEFIEVPDRGKLSDDKNNKKSRKTA